MEHATDTEAELNVFPPPQVIVCTPHALQQQRQQQPYGIAFSLQLPLTAIGVKRHQVHKTVCHTPPPMQMLKAGEDTNRGLIIKMHCCVGPDWGLLLEEGDDQRLCGT